MVVIPTHNGEFYLKNFVENAVNIHGLGNHKLLIVDTGTTDSVSLDILEDIKNKYSSDVVQIVKSLHGGYELGAMVTAIKMFPNEEKFLFMHDTTIPTSKEWISQFEDNLTPELGAIAWLAFQPLFAYCHQGHVDYTFYISGPVSAIPDSGFFGSIFMAHGNILRDFYNQGYLSRIIENKTQSECWERIWPLLFFKHGYPIGSIIPSFDRHSIECGIYPHLRKFFKGRQ